MRLDRLRFRNINSLKGEWRIDFNDSALSDSGIFLITGKTGAGKSTLLDAVCLALYGQTPRLQKLSASSNEAMTRNTGDCFAELEFTIDGCRYKSVWQQARARMKADGKLQQPQMRLYKLAPDGTETVLSEKVEKTKKEVETLTGLSMDAFQRSVLLAQGQFARFLNANAKERSDILQDMTGTAVYEQISRNCFEKTKQYKEEYQLAKTRLEGIAILTDKELAERREELKALSASLCALQEKKKEADKAQEILNALDTAQNEAEGAKERHNACLLADNGMAETREKLLLDDKAAVLDAVFGRQRAIEETRQKKQQETERLAAELPLLEEAQKKAMEEKDTLQKSCEACRQESEALAPKITEGRALETRLKEAEAEKAKADTLLKQARQEQKKHEKAVQEKESELLACTEEEKKLAEKLAASAADSGLAADLPALKVQLAQLKEKENDLLLAEKRCKAAAAAEKKAQKARAGAEKAVLEAKKAVTEAQDKKAEAEKELAKIQGALGGSMEGSKQGAMPLTDDMLKGLQEDQAACTESMSSWTRSLEALAGVLADEEDKKQKAGTLADKQKQALLQHEADQKALEEAGVKAGHLRTIAQQQKVLASLEEHRAALKDGCACPLCGALEHPYVQDLPWEDQAEDKLKEAEKALLQCEKAERASAKKLATLDGEAKAAMQEAAQLGLRKKEACKACASQVTMLAQRVQDLLQYAGASSLVPGLASHLDTAKTLPDSWSSLKDSEDAAASLNKEAVAQMLLAAQKAETEAREVKQEISSLITQIRTKQEAVHAAAEALALKDKEHARAEGDCKAALLASDMAQKETLESTQKREQAGLAFDAAQKEFFAAAAPYGFEQAASQDTDILAALEKRLEARTKLEQDHARQAERLGTLNGEAKLLQQKSALFAEKTAAAEQEAGTRSKAASSIAGELRTLLGGRTAAQVEEEAKKTLSEAETAYDKAKAKAEKAAGDVAMHQNTLATTKEALKESEEALKAVGAEALECSLGQGFASVQAARDARLAKDAKEALQKASETARTNLAKAKALLDDAEKKLNTLQKEKAEYAAFATIVPDNAEPSREEVQAACKDLEEKLGALQIQTGTVQQILDRDEQDRQRRALEERQFEVLKKTYESWYALNELIGSKDGHKFRNFAQGLTFAKLVEQANNELEILSDRYRLEPCREEPLELNVIDFHMGGESRSIKNLSGGECFQVSLALALALASFDSASAHIETMFLDEGFGTLDPEALDKAIDTLTSLRDRKNTALIGIISHVEALAERLTTQVHLHRGGDGYSSLEGPGCSKG